MCLQWINGKVYKNVLMNNFVKISGLFDGCENIYRNNCLKLYWNTFIQICWIYIEGKYMNNSVIAIQSFVITTIVYTLLVPVFFEIENNAYGEEKTLFTMATTRLHIVNK